MIEEEDTDDARIRRIINQEVNLPRTGVITGVHEHTDPDDRWNYHVDVRLGPDSHPRKIPLAVPTPGLAAPPRGIDHPDGPDMALVQYFEDDETERPVATHVLYNDEDRPPIGSAGIVRLRRGSLYAELADDGSYARLAQKSADDADPDLVVEIDSSGRVRLGDPSGELLPVARRGDAVEVDHPDYGTLSGQIIEGSSEVESS